MEAQTIRHRFHDKLMRAFLGPEVFEGTVVAANEHGSVTLSDGQSAAAEAGKPPVLRVIAQPRDAVSWALYYPPVIHFRPDELQEGLVDLLPDPPRGHRHGDPLPAGARVLDLRLDGGGLGLHRSCRVRRHAAPALRRPPTTGVPGTGPGTPSETDPMARLQRDIPVASDPSQRDGGDRRAGEADALLDLLPVAVFTVGVDGEIRHLQGSGRAIADERGNTVRLIGVCQDVTDRVEATDPSQAADASRESGGPDQPAGTPHPGA